VTDSWNPPTGPPNGAPVHPADAKREIDDAVDAAYAHDQRLRAHAAALAAARVEANARLDAATAEAEDARALAKRALGQANESARAGQRVDAAKWTGAAQVFAMRLRDARAAVAESEALVASSGLQRQQLDVAFRENIGRLQALAAARLPMLGGRKAARSQSLVDETVAALSAPVTDVEARAEADARAALARAAEAGVEPEAGVAEVADEDLEREVDLASTDEILDELRVELGLPAVGPSDVESPPAPAEASGGAGGGAGPREPQPAADRVAPSEITPPVPHASGRY